MEIRTKRKFFELWTAGLLGYKLRTWDSLGDYLDEPRKPPIVGFRQVGIAGGGAFATCHDAGAVASTAVEWAALGRRFMICEAAPDDRATVQGEVRRTERGLEGFLGQSKLRMRDAIAQGILKPTSYLTTLMLIRRFMAPSSQNDLEALLDLYPDAAVEFTCYDHYFEPGRNTIFWEVRNY